MVDLSISKFYSLLEGKTQSLGLLSDYPQLDFFLLLWILGVQPYLITPTAKHAILLYEEMNGPDI